MKGSFYMGKKILIVDDEPGIVAVVQNYFEMAGYYVVTAYNGIDAMKKLSQNPDIVLLDINMPDMDGLTVCQNIREHITCPVLFLTARIETSEKIKVFLLAQMITLLSLLTLMNWEQELQPI